VLAAQHELLAARAFRRTATGTAAGAALERAARGRLELFGLDPRELDAALARGEALRRVSLQAPGPGHVLAVRARRGARVEAGATLFELADLSRVWAVAEVAEQDAARIAEGQPARVTVPALGAGAIEGRVELVSPALRPGSRALQVRVGLSNRGLRLRPGMAAEVELPFPSGEAVVVPEEAVIDGGRERHAFVALARGRLEPRRVVIGGRAGGLVEVLEGVREGERVVTTGNFLVDAESRLQATLLGLDARAADGGAR
jgi:Cu(I)/Ag(I) efflux system membrane fusion protein